MVELSSPPFTFSLIARSPFSSGLIRSRHFAVGSYVTPVVAPPASRLCYQGTPADLSILSLLPQVERMAFPPPPRACLVHYPSCEQLGVQTSRAETF